MRRRRQVHDELPGEGFFRFLVIFRAAYEVEIHGIVKGLWHFVYRLPVEVHVVTMQVDDRALKLVAVDLDLPDIPPILHHGSIPIVCSKESLP